MDHDLDDEKAQEIAEAMIDHGLRAARQASQLPPATGRCFNCQEALDDPETRFCDTDCRDDWQKRQRASHFRRG